MRLPPEWWPQSAVLLTWPHADGDWGDVLCRVEQSFVDIARAISRRQRLIISCRESELLRQQLTEAGLAMANIRLISLPSNDIWVRDHGPLTVLEDDQPRLLDFQFNGWGGKYTSVLDNQITVGLSRSGALGNNPVIHRPEVIEGGAIEVNGDGCLLTTRNCLELASRNPNLGLNDLEALFAKYFGCTTVHWLNHGHMAGDDTDGHIDTLARFTDTHSIAYQACVNESDEHYAGLRVMAEELQALRHPDGQPYTLHALPLPEPLYNAQGQRLPAGYANFLIINGAVLMPAYADPADNEAASILAACFPDREVEMIDCRALVEQFGSLHCATMQLPAEVFPNT